MRHLLITAAIAAFALPAMAQDLVPLPVHVGGRVFPQSPPSQGYLHQWPGTYFESRFKGTSVTVRVNDSVNILNIWLDGRKVDTETKPGEGDIELGPLKDAEHTIRVEKITEAQGVSAQFTGFFVPSQANVLPAPADRPRRIEFIGDSYTVGYGNTSPKHECPGDGVWATTDNSQAFGPLTAKHYDADYRINAISGRGIVRNYNGFAANTLPEAYAFDLDLNGTTLTQNIDTWSPQIIVIGLGTNDFTTPLNPGEKWPNREAEHADYQATYIAFVESLRGRHPDAFFILMASDQVDGEIQAQVKAVMAGLQSKGESRIAFLPMNSLSFTGCDWHPSTADDRTVRDILIAFIDSHPELWQGK